MKFFKRHWPLVGVSLLLVLAVVYMVRSGKDFFRDSGLEKAVSGEGINLKDIHYTQDDPIKGMKWVLDAQEVHFPEDRHSVRFRNFTLKVKPDKKPSFDLKGENGTYLRSSGDLELWGHLEGHSEDGYRVVTERMRFNEKKGILSNDKPVQIFGSFFSISGKGVFVDLKNKQLKVLSQVTTVIREGAVKR